MLRVRAVFDRLGSELEAASTRYAEAVAAHRRVEVRQQELLDEDRALLEELARIYLPDLSPESVALGLEDLREELERALEAQEERRAQLAGKAEGADRRVRAAGEALEVVETVAVELAGELDAAQARLESILEGVEGHADEVAEHQALMEQRERLRNRRTRLGAAASAERHRYEGDRLFRYLHDRDYGGPAYRAGPLARRVDRWLANRIDYESLVRSYRILRFGPRRIDAEIRSLTRRAEELEAASDAREEEAARESGLLSLLERRAEVEARLGEARAELDRAHSARSSLQEELRALDANRGRHFEKAIALHREYLEGRSVRELEALARSTASPRDDSLVERLEAVRRELAELADEATARREAMRLASEELERVSAVFDGEAVAELRGAPAGDPFALEVGRPYFDALYRELTAAFDAGLGDGVVVEADWELDGAVETEVTVHGADGRVLRRRVGRRDLSGRRPRPEGVR